MENFNIPNNGKVKDLDNSFDYEYYGGSEKGEIEWRKNATLIKKSEVKQTTTDYKNRKIGHAALFSINDKLTA